MRKSRLAGTLIAAALLFPGCTPTYGDAASPAAPARDMRALARDVDALVSAAMARFDTVPAMTVAVATSRGPVLRRADGRADVEAGRRATAGTRFYIASSTKSFVGLAMALLDARGAIDLDWTLAELAPDIAFRPELRANEVTLRHLLSHSHGLEGGMIEYRLAYTGEHDPATLWRLLSRLEPNREAPLGTFRYGNLGYNVAALLVERRLGRSWQEIVETEVLRPLGLGETITRGVAPLRARGLVAAPYDSLGGDAPLRLYLQKEDDMMQSAGGMFSSANDLARWLQVNLAAERGLRTPLPAAVVAATHRPVATMDQRFEIFRRTGYGLGWYSGDFGGATLYHSFGGFTGARSHVSFMPQYDIGVAAVANDEGMGGALTDLIANYVYHWVMNGRDSAEAEARQLLDMFAERAATQRSRRAADRANRAQRTWRLSLPAAAYAGRYCSEDYGNMTLTEREGALALAWGRLRATLDPFTEPDTARVEAVPGEGRVMRFRIENGAVVGADTDIAAFRRCG